mgnify:CR=1 FL=1
MNKKPWLFGRKVANTNTESLKAPDQIKSSNIYRSIQTLPLHKFIDCIVPIENEDGTEQQSLASLIISGSPTETELKEAWANILQEYSEKIGNAEYKVYIKLYQEIIILELSLEQVYSLVDILQHCYDESLAKELNELLKTDCKFNWKDQASYQAELLKCIRRSKSIKIQHDLKMMQFEAIQKKHEGKEQKQDRAYYTSMLVTLSDHAKYHITEMITVAEYCERIKRFTQFVENLKSKK